ncbi:hypothetical protein ACFL0V_03800 [Nanoarchaeota archaeon]
MSRVRRRKVYVPSGIFKDRSLSPLESISEYLKEEKGLTYHEIAEMLKRDDRTIWTCVNRAKKKRMLGEKVVAKRGDKQEKIPLEIFHNRDLAPLEGISRYLREVSDMSLHEIAVLLNRDDRTIWTCYNRALKKLGPEGG